MTFSEGLAGVLLSPNINSCMSYEPVLGPVQNICVYLKKMNNNTKQDTGAGKTFTQDSNNLIAFLCVKLASHKFLNS